MHNTHLSALPLSILLLSTATQLWDGTGFDKQKTTMIPSMNKISIHNDRDKDEMDYGGQIQFEYACFTYLIYPVYPCSTRTHCPVSMFHTLLNRRKALYILSLTYNHSHRLY